MITVKAIANDVESFPDGNARLRVLGFNPSNRMSTIRLKVMAALRAPTIAATIHPICRPDGRPPLASTAPMKANGSAKIVCSNLIISSVIPSFFHICIRRLWGHLGTGTMLGIGGPRKEES
jgi:hypothetical protein